MSAKILVAVHSAADLFTIRNLLTEHHVLTVRNGLEAMQEMNAQSEIDLIILDLKMPGGFQVLTALNSNEKYKKIRAIILTKHDELDDESKGLKLGAVDYIRRPIHPDSFKVRIGMHIELLKAYRLFEHAMHENRLRCDAIFQNAPVGIAVSYSSKSHLPGESNLISINPMFEQIIGRTEKELSHLGWAGITHPDDLEADLDHYNRMQSGEINGYSMEKRYIRPDGSIVWVDMVVARLSTGKETDFNHICIVQDITERKTIEKVLHESERSKSVLLASLRGLAYRCNYDHDWTMQFVSQGSYDLTGYKAESFINNRDLSYNELIAPEYREFLWQEWVRTLAERRPFQSEYEIITKSGQRKWVLEMGQGIYDEYGNVEALEGIVLDISDRKELELQREYLSKYDTLTGLHNRNYFEEMLANDIEFISNRKRALININLSKVDLLTLTYGFHYSQVLIKKVAAALMPLCTKDCQLYSTYTNRLTFYIHGYRDKNELIEFCIEIEKILESILSVEGTGAGIGVLELDDSETDVKQIMKDLLIASENALNNPNQRYSIAFFDKEMESKILRQKMIQKVLERIAAGEEDSLYLEYQPVLDIKCNQICSFEALARVKTEELGIIPPLEFIPIAEETKLIIPLGKRIIYHALSFLSKLSAKGNDTVGVSINISAIQLLTDHFVSDLCELLDHMDVSPERLIIEVTESTFSNKLRKINKTFGEMKALGIEIAIDDFGTGYSSFARSQELEVNCLKIDKYFIGKLSCLEPEQAITGDIISMAHKLGRYVVAEGVEDEVQLQYLLDHGCDQVQGYLISRPMDEESAIELLKKGCLSLPYLNNQSK
ncbi:MAG TPA: EAL domain-containing protein [Clostridiales bacterium]|nr:EAL domain-containing protein [Clostridiales bacterium]